MGWGYYDYVPRQQKDPVKELEKLRKKQPEIQPVTIDGKKLAKSWWGNAWNKNLERYADYNSRLGRGRSYVRKGMVVDLRIAHGEIQAQVVGSGRTPYRVKITIDALSDDRWRSITDVCQNRVGSLSELMSGQFPEEFAALFFDRSMGLFPTPREIHLSCTCPDWADMCKHVAAALYGVGARLDSDPSLFFTLRGIDVTTLLKKSADQKVREMLQNADKKTARTLPEDEIAAMFGDVLS